MRNKIRQLVLLGSVALTATTSLGGPPAQPPRLWTLVVHHEEYTECGDLEIESGEVIVPEAMRERYLQAFANSPRSGSGDYSDRYGRIMAYCNSVDWRVGNVKLESEKDFENLFLLQGKKPSHSYDSSNNPWDLNRRYRVTVEVTGIKWSYLTVRVRKAVRLANRKD